MPEHDADSDHDQYRSGLSVRNGWRCRFCGRYPKPGESFGSDGVCPTCRDRLDRLQSQS